MLVNQALLLQRNIWILLMIRTKRQMNDIPIDTTSHHQLSLNRIILHHRIHMDVM